jgi:phosphatidylglycerol:prolipoprotein diacylglycerol transferase
MRQVLFRIPGTGVPVFGFGLMIVAAFYTGMLLAARRSRREGLDPAVVYDLALWLLIGGLAGARLLYVVEYWGETVHSFGEIFRLWEGGLVFYGSVFGAVVAVAMFRVFRTFPILATLDALAPSVAIGVALGRIGCFLNGCCYGGYCQIPWMAVRFPRGSPPWLAERAQGLIPADAPRSLPVHPTQLYLALDGLVLFALLTAFYPLRRRDGEVIGLLLVTYPVTRFVIDSFRDDEGGLFFGLTVAQLISLALLVVGAVYWLVLACRPRRAHGG